jgi:hypothetical protein
MYEDSMSWFLYVSSYGPAAGTRCLVVLEDAFAARVKPQKGDEDDFSKTWTRVIRGCAYFYTDSGPNFAHSCRR